MTRAFLVAGLCAMAGAGAAGAGVDTDAGLRAQLQVMDTRPIVVRGVGFEPGERVQLMFSSGAGQRWRATEAGSAGRFTMGFGVSVGACGRFMVQAFGSRGSRARLMPRRAQIDCVSPDRGTPTTTHGDSTK